MPCGPQALAVVINGAPARRDDSESPIVTIAREALAKFQAPVWSGQITNRADLLIALGNGEGAREYQAEGRAASEIASCGRRSNVRSRLFAARIGDRRDAQAGGIIFINHSPDGKRAEVRAFCVWPGGDALCHRVGI